MKRNAVLILLASVAARAQTTPPEAMPPAPRAITLPLSGRTAQTGTVVTVTNPLPAGLQSVNTITSTVQVTGPYQTSVPSAAAPGPAFPLTLLDAVTRGLRYNLGTSSYTRTLRLAEAQQMIARSALLPNVSADLLVSEEQINLAALGFTGANFPGVSPVVGPFHYFDARTGVSQTIYNRTDSKSYRSAQELTRSTNFASRDARDLVALAVAGAYLQAIAAAARVDTARAQVATAQTTYKLAVDRHTAGVVPRIDVTRSQVELQSQEQRLISVENDFAKRKLQLARIIGLPPGQDFTLADAIPYAPLTGLTLDQALYRAYANRSDLKAAESQVRAAELARQAARGQRFPVVVAAADYGVIGPSPGNSHGTFAVTGTVRVPIFEGGRIRADIRQTEAELEQRQAEAAALRADIDAEVRTAMLDLNSAARQVGVAESNRKLAADTLTQARDRFAAGVADTLEVVQAQESVAAAEQDYISSLYSYNLAKASLVRAMGQAADNLVPFLEYP